MPGCQEKCGNITIPYPFGIGSKCSVNPSFTVVCQNLTDPPKLFLSSLKLEVEDISVYGVVIVKQPVSPQNCSDGPRTKTVGISLLGSPFTISAHYNSMVVMGCKNSVWLRANKTTVGGCMAVCDANSTDSSCNGINCCQTTIPTRLQQIEFTYESIRVNSSFCGYVFPVNKKWLQNGDNKRYTGLLADPSNPFDQEFRFAPLVLEWEFGNLTESSSIYCKNPNDFLEPYNSYSTLHMSAHCQNYLSTYPEDNCREYPGDYRCRSLLDNYKYDYSGYDYVSSSRYCSCKNGFEGNPYLLEGCSDIDECSTNGCGHGSTCIDANAGYICERRNSYYADKNDGFRGIIKTISIVIGSVLGALILLAASWKLGKAIAKLIKVIKASRRYAFFKRNGGLLLEQQLDTIERIRLFSSIELAKATDDYNENRILGRGGEGIVYKGMLEDGRIVAVKNSERVNQGDVKSFINEVVIVSQINHRNVVKLLGCSLESEVPRLVYEFIPNGTLFHHIHDPDENFP